MKSINKILVIAFLHLSISYNTKADIGISGFISYTNHNYSVVLQDSLPGAGATLHANVTVQNFNPVVPLNSVYLYMRFPNSQFLKPDSLVSIPPYWELTDSILVGNETILRFTNTSAVPSFETSNFTVRVIAVDESLGSFNAVQAQMQYVSGVGSGWSIFPTSLTGLIATANVGDEPLPVNWLNFAAEQQNNVVNLNWSTTSEKNNYGFHIEKSTNGNAWNEIGFVNAANTDGWENSINYYEFIDNNPIVGVNLYRLKQVDFDGIFSYSTIRKVFFKKSGFITKIYPNPTKGNITIASKNPNYIIVSDIKGQIIKQVKIDIPTEILSVDLSELSVGIYTIRIICDSDEYMHQVTIVE